MQRLRCSWLTSHGRPCKVPVFVNLNGRGEALQSLAVQNSLHRALLSYLYSVKTGAGVLLSTTAHGRPQDHPMMDVMDICR